MGQADVFTFLRKYKLSKQFKERPWLTVREIHKRLSIRKNASELGSVTNSVKKLRESGMIKAREIKNSDKNSRKIYHYQTI